MASFFQFIKIIFLNKFITGTWTLILPKLIKYSSRQLTLPDL